MLGGGDYPTNRRSDVEQGELSNDRLCAKHRLSHDAAWHPVPCEQTEDLANSGLDGPGGRGGPEDPLHLTRAQLEVDPARLIDQARDRVRGQFEPGRLPAGLQISHQPPEGGGQLLGAAAAGIPGSAKHRGSTGEDVDGSLTKEGIAEIEKDSTRAR